MTIAVVDGVRGIGNGWTIPSGPLRAPFLAQAQMVDIIAVNGQCSQTVVTNLASNNFTGTVLNGHLKPVTTAAKLANTPVVAYSGIGNPVRFYRTLEGCGATVVERRSYPDHHPFTDAEATEILADAQAHSAMIVTTEKDLVRLAGAKKGTPRATLLERSYALPVAFVFQESCSGRLDALLDMIIRE
jgi:tetraacyldisaccharide 4'-kinase